MYLMWRHYMLMVVRYIVLWALNCVFWPPQKYRKGLSSTPSPKSEGSRTPT